MSTPCHGRQKKKANRKGYAATWGLFGTAFPPRSPCGARIWFTAGHACVGGARIRPAKRALLRVVFAVWAVRVQPMEVFEKVWKSKALSVHRPYEYTEAKRSLIDTADTTGTTGTTGMIVGHKAAQESGSRESVDGGSLLGSHLEASSRKPRPISKPDMRLETEPVQRVPCSQRKCLPRSRSFRFLNHRRQTYSKLTTCCPQPREYQQIPRKPIIIICITALQNILFLHFHGHKLDIGLSAHILHS